MRDNSTSPPWMSRTRTRTPRDGHDITLVEVGRTGAPGPSAVLVPAVSALLAILAVPALSAVFAGVADGAEVGGVDVAWDEVAAGGTLVAAVGLPVSMGAPGWPVGSTAGAPFAVSNA